MDPRQGTVTPECWSCGALCDPITPCSNCYERNPGRDFRLDAERLDAERLAAGSLVRGYVMLDSFDHADALPAWLPAQRWNGWAIPLFDMAACRRLEAWVRDNCQHETGWLMRYEPELDAWRITWLDGQTPDDLYPSVMIGTSKHYAIGQSCWCWWIKE